VEPIIARPNQHKHLTVHVVPHTHDDVGWLKTVDEYFVGAKTGRVNLILSGAIEQLRKDPRRKFTYTEMKFFTLWYNR